MSDEETHSGGEGSGASALGDAVSRSLGPAGETLSHLKHAAHQAEKSVDSLDDDSEGDGVPKSPISEREAAHHGAGGFAENPGDKARVMVARDSNELSAATQLSRAKGMSGLAHGAQSFMAHGASMAINAGNSLMGFGVTAAKSGLSMFTSMGSAVSGATGGAIGATAGGLASFGAIGVVMSMIGTLLLGGFGSNAKYEGVGGNTCGDGVKDAMNAAETALGGEGTTMASAELQKKMEANAKQVYSVFHKWGMSNEAIAGALGNMQLESAGIDNTAVEGVYTEPYTLGPKKQQAAKENFDRSTWDPYHGGMPNIKNLGIGLIQFTNTLNTDLQAYAKAHGKTWDDIGIQLAMMLDPKTDAGSRVNKFKSGTYASIPDAEWAWQKDVERITAPLADKAQRIANSEKWMALIPTWGDGDTSFADSVISQAGTGTTSATGSVAVANAVNKCASAAGGNYDNSSAAKAAISYAFPFYNDSKNNEGTDLYKEVHLAIWGSNVYESNPLPSCDNGVSTAIRWSDTDATYPEQAVVDQYNYVEAHPEKWEKVDWKADLNNLKPGDVLINSHNGGSETSHTAMFVGKELPMEAYGGDQSKFEPNANMVSASHNPPWQTGKYSRSPGLGVLSVGEGGYRNDWPNYYVYRNKQADASGNYKTKVITTAHSTVNFK